MLHEEAQQLVLHVREVQRVAGERRLVGERVERQILERQDRVDPRRRVGQPPNPNGDLCGIRGMGDEVGDAFRLLDECELGGVGDGEHRQPAVLDQTFDVTQSSHRLVAEIDNQNRPRRDCFGCCELETVDVRGADAPDGECCRQLLRAVLGVQRYVHMVTTKAPGDTFRARNVTHGAGSGPTPCACCAGTSR